MGDDGDDDDDDAKTVLTRVNTPSDLTIYKATTNRISGNFL